MAPEGNIQRPPNPQILILGAHAEACLPEAVTNARAENTSWEDIARFLGTTPETAQARYDSASPTADTRTPHNY